MLHTKYSKLFVPSAHGRYFLAHSIGLMPKSTEAAFKTNFLDTWHSGAEDIWPRWLASISEFNSSLAALLNTQPSLICPQSNVSSGLSKLIMALPKRTGKNVILASESDFPSAAFVLQQAERLGYTLRFIPKSQDLQDLSTWEQALTSDVHTAFITHVHYNTNTLTPINDIAEVCDARGITSIVDSAQAIGIVPIDLSESKIDVVLGSCIKWLCGGPGAGFLWINKELISQLEPYDVGWFSHKNPFEFDLHNFEYAEDASRFWGGTPSVAAYVGASNSIRLIHTTGIDVIQAHNRELTQRLMNAVPEDSIVSPKDLTKKGGTTVLKFADQSKVEQALRDNKILFDARQLGIRVSPHIYSTPDDIDCLVDCITKL